jgi:hypothetical protein
MAADNPTSVQQYQTGFAPEIAPYGEALLGQGAFYTNPATNPYMQYQGSQVAGFTPMQQQSYDAASQMQSAPQLGDATAMAGTAGLNALNTNYTYNPYQTQSFTSPGMAQTYMNPYLDVQNAATYRQNAIANAQNNAQATTAGAFGGGRQAIMNAQNQNTLQSQLAKNQFDAYNQAQGQFNIEQGQAQNAAQLNAQQGQFGANIGLQGLNTALQGANTLGTLGTNQYNQNLGVIGLQNQLGGQQQQQVQNAMNVDYNNFQNQQNYPYQQMNFMSNLIRGLPMTQQAVSMYQAPPSTLSQVAGLGLGVAGLSKLAARGGSTADIKSHGLQDLALAQMGA